ncbi:MAG TPA: M23 family metallopeptidase [Rubricoccaceae bacterium]|nr:M23 family metallopeptidase [Rubricoccaceae bacterium]
MTTPDSRSPVALAGTPLQRRSCLPGCLLQGLLTLALLVGGLLVVFPPMRHPGLMLRLLTAEPEDHLPVPVAGVRPRDLANTWGAPRSGGRTHQGIDIFAPRGTPVLSATPGLVVTVGENNLGGQIVRVLGPGREWHYYAHLDRFGAFESGDVVAEGDTLGYVGTTGNARGTPPHLHYGIYAATGEAQNPYPRLVP